MNQSPYSGYVIHAEKIHQVSDSGGSEAGGHGGPGAPEVPDETLVRTLVVGRDRWGGPQQPGGAGVTAPHCRETEVVVGFPDGEGGGSHHPIGERDPDGTASGDQLPGTRGPDPERREPDPVRPWSSGPQVNLELVASDYQLG